MAGQDSAAQKTTASPAKTVTIEDVDYYYTGKVNRATKALLEEGDKVPVWIQEEKGADYWGAINGLAFIIRSSRGMDRPRMVPPALAGNYANGRQAEREHREDIERRQREMSRPLAQMPEYIR